MNKSEKQIINKPKKQSHEAYDWQECQDYIEHKYKIKIRDYAEKLSKKNGKLKYLDDVEYQDFWHWICDTKGPHNGSYFFFYQEDLDSIEKDWQKTIFNLFMEEFGEGKDEDRCAEFYVWW